MKSLIIAVLWISIRLILIRIRLSILMPIEIRIRILTQVYTCWKINSPGFDPSILRHSGIWGAADEAVLNTVHREQKSKKSPLFKIFFDFYSQHCQLKSFLPFSPASIMIQCSIILTVHLVEMDIHTDPNTQKWCRSLRIRIRYRTTGYTFIEICNTL